MAFYNVSLNLCIPILDGGICVAVVTFVVLVIAFLTGADSLWGSDDDADAVAEGFAEPDGRFGFGFGWLSQHLP